jgi:hypothetical protein
LDQRQVVQVNPLWFWHAVRSLAGETVFVHFAGLLYRKDGIQDWHGLRLVF